jgi:hypothetical protein
MIKTKLMLMLAGFLAAAALAAPAQAGGGGGGGKNHDAKGDCGKKKNNWKLVKLKNAKCDMESKKVDKWGNHDGYVCEKWKNGRLEYKDNDD